MGTKTSREFLDNDLFFKNDQLSSAHENTKIIFYRKRKFKNDHLNPFVPNAHFLYRLKTSENRKSF